MIKNEIAPSFLTLLQVQQAHILGGILKYRDIDISEYWENCIEYHIDKILCQDIPDKRSCQI